ncbi:COG1470 family protein [Roseivirga echinicomitans]
MWRFFSVTVIGLLLLTAFNFTNAQTNSVIANGFTLSFVNATTIGSVDEVATNVLRVNNGTSRTIIFSLDISSPAGWTTLSSRDKNYTVAANDSLFIPVRIIPQKNSEGNVNYFVNASAVSSQNIPLASTPWNLEIKKVSQWKANVLDKVAYFPSSGDSTSFRINFTNTGNSSEDVYVLFSPPIKVTIADSKGKPIAENAFSMNLPIGIDTTLRFVARLNNGTQKDDFFSSKPMLDKESEEGAYRLQIQVRDNAGGSASSGGRVELLRLGNEIKAQSKEGNSSIPLTMEFNSYNILSQFTNFSLDLYGDVDLALNKNLRYYYQTIISNSAYTGTQFLGSYRFAQYTTPKYQVAAGDIGDNMELLLNGTGIKGHYDFGKVKVGGIYVKRQQNGNLQNYLTNIGLRVSYNQLKDIQLEAEMVSRKDEFNDIDGSLVTANGSYRISNSQILRLNAGFSQERHTQSTNPFETTGYGFGAKYSVTYKGVSLASQVRLNSPNFLSQYRGTSSLNLNVRYPFKEGQFFSLRTDLNTRNAEIYSKGFLFPQNRFKRNVYELQYGWSTENGNFVLFPRIHDDEVLGIKTVTTGGGVIFSSSRNSEFRVYSRFYTGFTKALDYDIDPYLVARWENTIRYKNLNVTARYYYGPYGVLDNLRVVEDGINPQSAFISAFATLNFRKARLSVRPTFNVSYESVLARVRSNFSPQLTFYSKNDFQFTLTGELFRINQGESPLPSVNAMGDGVFNTYNQSNFLLRFGIKKTFNIKRPGSKSHDLEVVVFKDLNGNNKRDVGEEFVKDALISIKDMALMTNENGVVIFKNLSQDEYKVNSDVLSNVEGWFKGDGQTVILDKDRTVFIPLKRGVQVKGNILLQQAQYSALGAGGMNLSGIRVNMTDNNGNTFTALSGQGGEFNLYVPFGLYTIQVNEQAVDEQFQFAQSSYTLNVNNVNVNYQVTFYLIEKSRKVNIIKFDNKGDNK